MSFDIMVPKNYLRTGNDWVEDWPKFSGVLFLLQMSIGSLSDGNFFSNFW